MSCLNHRIPDRHLKAQGSFAGAWHSLDSLRCLQATYDEQSGEFVIHTPRDTASKFWIGGAAQHGKVGAVQAGPCAYARQPPGEDAFITMKTVACPPAHAKHGLGLNHLVGIIGSPAVGRQCS